MSIRLPSTTSDQERVVTRVADVGVQGHGDQQELLNTALSRERERIATYLHDEVLQSFATCFLNAQLCERFLQMERRDLLCKELQNLQAALTDAIDQARELLGTLEY